MQNSDTVIPPSALQKALSGSILPVNKGPEGGRSVTQLLSDPELIPQLQLKLAEAHPRPHHSGLIQQLEELLPGVRFHYQLSRSGWYRPGGLISPLGEVISRDIESWLDQQEAHAGDFDTLLMELEPLNLKVFNLNGSTHFFTVSTGPRPQDCWQLEVEELQEVMCRPLISQNTPAPEDMADLLEPLAPELLEPQPISWPGYRFSKLRPIGELYRTAVNQSDLQRFFDDWLQITQNEICFDHHWFFQVSETLSRYGLSEQRLQPKSVRSDKLRLMPWDLSAPPSALSSQIRCFDKAAGYAGAWFLGMVAGNLVPRELPARLQRDWQEEYRYLPESLMALVRHWLHRPYTL